MHWCSPFHATSAQALPPAPPCPQVLDGTSLSVPRATFHMLLGANGCGKSTLLRVLGGLFRPEAGSVHGAARRQRRRFWGCLAALRM